MSSAHSMAFLWLALLLTPPLVVAAVGALGLLRGRLRRYSLGGGAFALVAGSLGLFTSAFEPLSVAWPWVMPAIFGASLLRVSPLTAPLLILPTALWLITVAATPKARLVRGGLTHAALSTAATTLAFLTESPALVATLWLLSSVLYASSLSAPEHRRTRRVVRIYLGVSVLVLVAGVALTTSSVGSSLHTAGLWLIVVAVAIRKGIFPFHAWIPTAFERGRLGPVVRFSAPQLGAYTAAILVVPQASPTMLRTVAILSLITAAYGAMLAVVQRDTRRATGYLFVSQSALVLAGLDCTTPAALAGSLVLWFSSALAFTGLARAVLSVEARRGRTDLGRLHGGYDQMPLLAASFLVLGLACTGFPGTLGFVGQEMLIGGAVHEFPALGFLTVVTAALTGLAVMRMYFSLFCGSATTSPALPLRLRESLIFGAVAATLIVLGFLPQGIVRSRLRASETMLEQRASLRASAPWSTEDRPHVQ